MISIDWNVAVMITGFIILIFFNVWVGLALLLIGSFCSRSYTCSACGNKIESTSKICPTCKAEIQD